MNNHMLWYNDGLVPMTYPGLTGLLAPRCRHSQPSQGKLSLTMPTHVFAASHTVCKNITEKLKVRCVETNKYEVVPTADSQLPPLSSHRVTMHDNFSDNLPHPNK